jgi:surface polysaccharide O-acyltransferase-like enzyme
MPKIKIFKQNNIWYQILYILCGVHLNTKHIQMPVVILVNLTRSRWYKSNFKIIVVVKLFYYNGCWNMRINEHKAILLYSEGPEKLQKYYDLCPILSLIQD